MFKYAVNSLADYVSTVTEIVNEVDDILTCPQD